MLLSMSKTKYVEPFLDTQSITNQHEINCVNLNPHCNLSPQSYFNLSYETRRNYSDYLLDNMTLRQKV